MLLLVLDKELPVGECLTTNLAIKRRTIPAADFMAIAVEALAELFRAVLADVRLRLVMHNSDVSRAIRC